MGRRVFLALAILTLIVSPGFAQSSKPKLGPLARERALGAAGWSRVIVHAADNATAAEIAASVRALGGRTDKQLPIIKGHVAYLPDAAIAALADHPRVGKVSLDRVIVGANERTAATVGATAVRRQLAYDGAGIGIAMIDSGVTVWHDDLATLSGGQRVVRFVDLLRGRSKPYDDNGHGTHVAGIIAGNGYDSDGARAGIAPSAHLLVIKALDHRGVGRISDVIDALDYVVRHKDALNIRIVNLSLSAGVFESYDTDPLTLAARRAVEAGLVVVTAAGNRGRNTQGLTQYGGVSAPGNAPWVLTVGASSHMGTIDRSDDTVARFSSRGPTGIDYAAKPDVLAPGVGIESLSDPLSALYATKSVSLLEGTRPTPYLPYLSLSGTSMSAPVVTGTVALMLQANPSLTPNQVKAIIQFTSEASSNHDPLTQGAGFLNARGAVELARFFADPAAAYPSSDRWSGRLIWGNQLVRGGRLTRDATAWAPDVRWGATITPRGENVAWGVICNALDCRLPENEVAWGGQCLDSACTTVMWGGGESRNVVWGGRCGGGNCTESADDGETVVWGSTDDDTVVWGSDGDETVVWGSDGDDTVVWGSDGDETVVWGSNDGETVVWGFGCTDPSCEPVNPNPHE